MNAGHVTEVKILRGNNKTSETNVYYFGRWLLQYCVNTEISYNLLKTLKFVSDFFDPN